MVKLRIEELRKERNISQKTLAEKVGVAQSAISHWEKGVYEPNASSLILLAKYFDVIVNKTHYAKKYGYDYRRNYKILLHVSEKYCRKQKSSH